MRTLTPVIESLYRGDSLLVIWKSNQSDKIKSNFFPSRARVHTSVWMHHMDAD